MGSGALIELISRGKQDIPLIGNPQLSFFKTVYHRYTNFTMEPIRNVFNETPDFGRKSTCYIDRKGDLLHQMYLEIELPALATNISWVNGIGNQIIKSVELHIGGECIDKISGRSLDVYQELTTPFGIKKSYYDMIGKFFTYNKNTNTGTQYLYVFLPFWFCRDISRALPLINLSNNSVSVIVEFEQFYECWYKRIGESTPWDTSNQVHITNVSLLCTYIYLDMYERKKLLTIGKREFLIEQFQEPATVSIYDNQPSIMIDLFLNHCVKEIIWFYQSEKANTNNDTNNYGNILNYNTLNETVTKPLSTISLKYNGNDRFMEMYSKYFSSVQIFQSHTCSPENYIYLYSFAINPEINQPCGTCNFSKIDDIKMNMTFTDNILEGNIYILAVNYNILRIDKGMGGLLFSS